MADKSGSIDKPTVLIVDDSPDDIALISELLKDLYKIKIAGNGERSLKVAQSAPPPDVILLDIMMPVMDGYETCRRLKESPETLNIPVIFLTSKTELEDELKGFALGAVDYITKPISPPILLARVQTHLKLKQVSDYLKDNNQFLEAEVQRRTQEAVAAQKVAVQAEKALRKSEVLNRRLVEHLPHRVFVKDRNSVYLSCNTNYARDLGVTPEQLIGKSSLDVHPAELAEAYIAADHAVMESGQMQESEERRIIAGQERWTHKMKMPYRDDQGNITGVVSIFEDITDRRKAVEALRKSEEYFRAIIENASDITLVVDKKGMISFASPSIEQTLGYKPEEIIGKSSLDLIAPADVPRAMQDFGKVILAKGKLVENSFAVRHKDGSERILEGVAKNLLKDPSVAGFIMNVHDVTERKLAEEHLQVTLESLRKAVGTTVQVISSTVAARDPYTAGHQIRSANLARVIATDMRLPPEKIEGIRMAGSIHDIGKISIPAEILSKPTKLSEIELSLIQEHARRGFEMLKDVESPWPLAEIVHQHHERMDGSGYPRHLRGEEILIEARILSVADVVEAMASHRPYRAGLGIDAALNEIEKNRGIFYDEAVVDVCLRLFREKGFKLERS
jgi:PAS domain S-box-containing protein